MCQPLGYRTAVAVGTRMLLAKTCTSCEELKQASEYKHRGPQGYWGSMCNRCQDKAAHASTKQSNHKSWDTASRRYARLTEEDLKVVKEMTEAGYSARECAKALGRSINSIYAIRCKFLKEG